MLGVHNDVQIAVTSRGFHKRVIAGEPAGGDTYGFIVMAATARYDIRHLGLLSRDAYGARVALVCVGVAGDHGVRADAGRFAGIVNLLEHRRAATVTALAERRMMNANNQ